MKNSYYDKNSFNKMTNLVNNDESKDSNLIKSLTRIVFNSGRLFLLIINSNILIFFILKLNRN